MYGENIYIENSSVITVGASIPGIVMITSNEKYGRFTFKNLTFKNISSYQWHFFIKIRFQGFF